MSRIRTKVSSKWNTIS